MRAWLALVLLLWPCVAAAWSYGPYPARVERVVDGDTLVVVVEVWPELTVRARLRLAGIDAPELRAPAACERRLAEAARAEALAWVARGPVAVTLTDRDKYGRALGRVHRDGADLAETLMAAGLARPYDGGRRRPWCED